MNVRMILMLALSCLASVLLAQTPAHPKVIASNLLFYPGPARSLGISGVVLVSVVTDGSKPVAVDCLSGPPTLVDSSLAFVRSWRFVPHKHTKFTAELTYKLVEPSSEEENPEEAPTQETLTLFLPSRATIQSTIIPNGCAGIEVKIPPKK